MDALRIDVGFRDEERDRVAELYWEAFGRKLRPGFADEPTGCSVLRDALRPDRVLVARDAGRVVGVCGFSRSGAGVADLSWSRLRKSLPVFSALRAILVLSVLSRPGRTDSLVLDGICVDRAVRGRGIGSSLLHAAADEARRNGASTVSLSVVDTNPRARALYDRLGFLPTGRGELGILSVVYGFDTYTSMQLAVAA